MVLVRPISVFTFIFLHIRVVSINSAIRKACSSQTKTMTISIYCHVSASKGSYKTNLPNFPSTQISRFSTPSHPFDFTSKFEREPVYTSSSKRLYFRNLLTAPKALRENVRLLQLPSQRAFASTSSSSTGDLTAQNTDSIDFRCLHRRTHPLSWPPVWRAVIFTSRGMHGLGCRWNSLSAFFRRSLCPKARERLAASAWVHSLL